MKKHIITILAAAIAAPAFAGDTATSVDPVYSTTTRTECHQATSANMNVPGWLGQSLGAVLGAAAGSQVGGGKGNTIATASGAVIGAQAGAALTNSQPQAQPQQECRQIIDRHLDGYSIDTESGRRVFVPLSLMQSLSLPHGSAF